MPKPKRPTRRARKTRDAPRANTAHLDEGEQGSSVELKLDAKLRRQGWRFDAREADRICAFFEQYLRHSSGKWFGQTVKLEAWQRRILRRLFGWRRPNGTRRYRRLILWVPRKNGKSFLASGIALYLLVADNEPGAQVYCAAANREQAEAVFGECKKMVRASEPLLEMCEPYKSSIFMPTTLSKLEAISSKAGTKHGLNVHGVIIDEVHVFSGRELYDVLTTASGTRRQPMEVVISTAGSDPASFAGELWDEASNLIRGTTTNPECLAVIFAADPDDDWRSPETWRKANPNFGVSIDEDYLAGELRKVEGSPGREATFKQLYLNLWAQSAKAWLPGDVWRVCGDKALAAIDALAGVPCWGGLDLSRSKDMTAFAVVAPPPEGDEESPWRVWVQLWMPEAGIAERGKRDRVDYESWAEQGWLELTPGNVVDYDRVEARLVEVSKLLDLRDVGYDPWGAPQLVQRLQDYHGLTMVKVPQGFRDISAPSKDFERLLLQRRWRHGGNPIMQWQVSNVIVRTDPNENIKPDKAKSRHRIDSVVASIIATGRASVGRASISGYETRGLLVLGNNEP